MLYDDVDVRSLYRVETKISNSGNRPIHPNEFIEPIRLTFEQPSKVLTAAVTSQSPAEIGANINHTHQEITVHALLLNPKDSFSIRALIGDLEVEPAVSGRIVGVKEIMKMPARAVVWIIRTACFATLIAIIGGVWTLLEASVFAFAVSYAGFVLMSAAPCRLVLSAAQGRSLKYPEISLLPKAFARLKFAFVSQLTAIGFIEQPAFHSQ